MADLSLTQVIARIEQQVNLSRQHHQDAVALSFDTADACLILLRQQQGWQQMATHKGHGPVIVSRPSDELAYQATTAFLDVTGVWRVFRSEGGMTPLRFEPTHWMPLPSPPSGAE
jgi:hypothetical protein